MSKKSPTLDKISDAFDKIKEKLHNSYSKSNSNNKNKYLFIYPILVFAILIYMKPKIILEKNKDLLFTTTKDVYNISYPKLFLWFILLQIPTFIYLYF